MIFLSQLVETFSCSWVLHSPLSLGNWVEWEVNHPSQRQGILVLLPLRRVTLSSPSPTGLIPSTGIKDLPTGHGGTLTHQPVSSLTWVAEPCSSSPANSYRHSAHQSRELSSCVRLLIHVGLEDSPWRWNGSGEETHWCAEWNSSPVVSVRS